MKLTKRALLLGTLGLASYLLFLAITFPASQAYTLFGDRLPVQAYGLSGSIWSGQAAVATIEGQRLEAVQWKLRPSHLLTGRLASDVQARLPNGSVSGYVNVSGNSLRARDLRLDMPVDQLLNMADVTLPARIGGRFDISMRSLRIENERLTEADGMLTWHQATLNLGRPLQMGSLNLRLEPGEDGMINGTLISQGGPIDLSGDLRIRPDGDFDLEMTVRALEGAEDAIGPAMGLLGIPADGTPVRSRLSGNLDGTNIQLTEL
ncbi:hypothetical protein CAI21_02065 [Alkalilimnicola ehrlichii]|uniref:Type II secretion system protein N n=1 Tax=Alkalilimnicola ehrlichii TaxID=351052 RepID=A0A3E0X1E2_9GAMM|nr:type II secretion system protein N [Alkalilimnicola ehrlichii]RFA31421.1 hypothetical protein CAI21_02065 [Alkalilimnicola ehrlichii]RFA39307.1 hypothetical protein CAL65_00330 [Alkalilimnicola ehrlichii]